MKFDELKYFLEVCECKSFNMAARNLFISRQSLIRNITNLENELNTPLFSRGYAGVELTEFGQAFYEKSKPAIRILQELSEFPEEYAKKDSHSIIIGIRGKFRSAYTMRCLIKDFQNENPEIHVETVDGSGSEIVSFVESQRLNLGFSLLEPTLPECIKSIPILSMEQVVLMKANHPFAKEEYITPGMLHNKKIAIAAFSSVPSQTLFNFLERENAIAAEVFATVDLGLSYKLCLEEDYLSFMIKRDAILGCSNNESLVYKPLKPTVKLQMGLIYNKTTTLTLQQKLFIEYVKNHFHEY